MTHKAYTLLDTFFTLFISSCYHYTAPTPPTTLSHEDIRVTPRTYAPFSTQRYYYPRYDPQADNPYYSPHHYAPPSSYRYVPYRPQYYAPNYPTYDPSADNPYYPLRRKRKQAPKNQNLFDVPLFTD